MREMLKELLWVLLPALASAEPHPLPSLLVASFGKGRSLARSASESKGIWLTAASDELQGEKEERH